MKGRFAIWAELHAMNSQRIYAQPQWSVEAEIDGKWIPIFTSHHRHWVKDAFATYQRIAPWPVRFVKRESQPWSATNASQPAPSAS